MIVAIVGEVTSWVLELNARRSFIFRRSMLNATLRDSGLGRLVDKTQSPLPLVYCLMVKFVLCF